MVVLRILSAVSLLAACEPIRTDFSGPLRAEAVGGRGPLVIRDAVGGQIYETAVIVRSIARSGRPVRLEGDCLSACAMFLALDDVCYALGTRFGFHAATDPERRRVDPPSEALFVQHLPEGVAAWFLDSGASARLVDFVYLSAAELAALDDEPRLCPI